MSDVVLWLLAVEALGLAALPLVWWLLPALPGRGLAFAKPLGLLLVGYAIWLGSSFGLLANRRATLFVLMAVLAAASWGRWGRQAWAWLRANPRHWLYPELVFLAGFALLAAFRAYNPAISGTEKPMDFAFLNAALRAESAPPQDPWLAGYGISYYYFGYYLMAVLVKLAGVAPAVGFNLALAFLFGATAAGSFGLLYSLVAGRAASTVEGEPTPFDGGAAAFALLGPLLLLFLANWEAVFEVLRQTGRLSSEFVRWLNIRDLATAPVGPQWYPSDPPDTWWWWRATRVVGTFDPATGVSGDYTINEFPFFSFLLGDLHPHVMALPFVVFALSLCLAVLRWPRELTAAALGAEKGRAVLYVLCFGALGFLNTWDLPVFLGLLALCYALQRALVSGRPLLDFLGRAAAFGAGALVVCFLTYWPFFAWLHSQVGGIGLVTVRTQWQHLAIFWGPLLALAFALPLAAGDWFDRARRNWWAWLAAAVALLALGLAGLTSLAVLLALAGLAGLALLRRLPGGGPSDSPGRSEDVFALALVLLAGLLLAACEVIYVRDGFGNRMNTVFKLYYQSWALLAVAGAYTVYCLGSLRRVLAWRGVRLIAYRGWLALAAIALAGGMVYTLLAPLSKTAGFAGPATLDGLAWLNGANPYEGSAIAWLQGVEGTPVILEASGAEYGVGNQGSAFTGLPSVLGWVGHEYQWRGSTTVPAVRKADVDAIYRTQDLALAERLLRQYGVTYVYVGDSERQAYGGTSPGALAKFGSFMDVAFRNQGVTIYRLRQAPVLAQTGPR
ncbi:MAG: DUF2298 domain-containing protein [Chloroflexi bacterium]|nr:DUF2298 domain-containing protein [Chloroflexota bacterium]